MPPRETKYFTEFYLDRLASIYTRVHYVTTEYYVSAWRLGIVHRLHATLKSFPPLVVITYVSFFYSNRRRNHCIRSASRN